MPRSNQWLLMMEERNKANHSPVYVHAKQPKCIACMAGADEGV